MLYVSGMNADKFHGILMGTALQNVLVSGSLRGGGAEVQWNAQTLPRVSDSLVKWHRAAPAVHTLPLHF